MRTTIQNFLVGLVRAATFPVVTYDKSTGLASEAGNATPKTVLTNETAAQFGDAAFKHRMGREKFRPQTSWKFELRLSFAEEVSLDAFVSKLTDPVPHIPEAANAQVHLLGYSPKHPVQHGSANGTEVAFMFDVLTIVK